MGVDVRRSILVDCGASSRELQLCSLPLVACVCATRDLTVREATVATTRRQSMIPVLPRGYLPHCLRGREEKEADSMSLMCAD